MPPPQWIFCLEWVIHVSCQKTKKEGLKMTEETLLTCILESIQNLYHNNSESGNSLPEVIQNIRHQPYEIAAIFDQYGHKICEQTNHREELCAIALPAEWQASAHLMIHNHVVDGTFSPEDIVTAKDLDIQIVLVVTPHYNFYLLRPVSGWPDNDDWLEEYRTIIQMYQHHRRYDYNLDAARHLALLKVAQHHRMTYYVTDIAGHCIPAGQQLKAS